jgi:hypothetical protein
MSQPLASGSMSQSPATTPSSSSNIERIFDTALESYKKKTKQDLKKHEIFKLLEQCDSPSTILAKFQADQFNPSRTAGDRRFEKYFVPTAHVLYAFSATLGGGVALVNINSSFSDLTLMSIRRVFSPSNAIFTGFGVLLLVSGLAPADSRDAENVLRQLKMSLRAKTS